MFSDSSKPKIIKMEFYRHQKDIQECSVTFWGNVPDFGHFQQTIQFLVPNVKVLNHLLLVNYRLDYATVLELSGDEHNNIWTSVSDERSCDYIVKSVIAKDNESTILQKLAQMPFASRVFALPVGGPYPGFQAGTELFVFPAGAQAPGAPASSPRDLLTYMSFETRLDVLLGFAEDLKDALVELHAAGFRFRDLKPENVVVLDGKARLIDVAGMMCPQQWEVDHSKFSVTLGYFGGLDFRSFLGAEAADWWALTLILLQMFSRRDYDWSDLDFFSELFLDARFPDGDKDGHFRRTCCLRELRLCLPSSFEHREIPELFMQSLWDPCRARVEHLITRLHKGEVPAPCRRSLYSTFAASATPTFK